MEQEETSSDFMQYYYDNKFWVDHNTFQKIINCKHKVQSFRLMKKLEPYIESMVYKNLKLYPTEVAENFWDYYSHHIK